jgi:hypothetical protein
LKVFIDAFSHFLPWNKQKLKPFSQRTYGIKKRQQRKSMFSLFFRCDFSFFIRLSKLQHTRVRRNVEEYHLNS